MNIMNVELLDLLNSIKIDNTDAFLGVENATAVKDGILFQCGSYQILWKTQLRPKYNKVYLWDYFDDKSYFIFDENKHIVFTNDVNVKVIESLVNLYNEHFDIEDNGEAIPQILDLIMYSSLSFHNYLNKNILKQFIESSYKQLNLFNTYQINKLEYKIHDSRQEFTIEVLKYDDLLSKFKIYGYIENNNIIIKN